MPDDDLTLNRDSAFNALSRIGPICDAFEIEFQRDSQPRIEDYLALGNPLDRKLLLVALLKLDIKHLSSKGKIPSFDQYFARFPDEVECLRSVLNHVETIDSDSSQAGVTQTVAGGLPKRLGNYELLAVLGQGGMGVVYRAVQYAGRTPIREVALKLVRMDKWFGVEDSRNSLLLARFREETRHAAQLEHPNIIRVYDVGQFDGLDFFSMQLIVGTDLSMVMKNEPLSYNRIAETLIPVARAIAFAHDRGIVHRDLKPSNILLDLQGKPFIADFGLSKSTVGDADLTHTGQILGTPGYMAPEQASGEYKQVGAPADIYGLGGLLYYCLTGQAPFVATNVLDALVKVLESDPVPPRTLNAQVPRSLELICMRCLEKKAEDRYSTALEVAEDLERFLNGLPTNAQAPTIIERLRRFGRRSPVISSHLGALGLVLLLGQLQFFIGTKEDITSEKIIFHAQVSSLMLGWIAMSALCGSLSGSKRLESLVATIWLCADAVFLTAVISMLSDETFPPGAILIGYPMIVVGGGMFFQARMVVFVTIAAMLSYVVLLILEPYMLFRLFPHAVFLVLLACMGICSLHQVRRFRMLSNYIEANRTHSL